MANKEEIKILESAEALQEKLNKTQAFLENNKKIVSAVLGGIVGIIATIVGYNWYVQQQNEEAENQLFPAIFYLEKDSLNKALYGDNNTTDGFVAIAENYSSTRAGNLANFYAGFIFLKKGEFDKAIQYLKEFDANDLLVQARAYCLIGDAYMEKKEYQNAASFYEKAASYKPTEEFTPIYLLKLGLAYEAQNNLEKANQAYTRIIEEFENSPEVEKAKKSRARNGMF
ncbi:MAG: tetratricopeptide repeat protein [Cytophagales bacterium]|nr:tetratricopeptide repeat protein [Cytophagales bacterium]MDW8384476.1 tetratricopeptide repeat protein [Flammeovirgaceae bacterium]